MLLGLVGSDRRCHDEDTANWRRRIGEEVEVVVVNEQL